MATQALTTQNGAADIMEQVIVQGDLGKLSPGDRVRYYQEVCQSIGLNPLSQPFGYITLNGKLTLYALKTCTDQLRKISDVSITIDSRDFAEGLCIVTVTATTPNGRTDSDMGVVPIDGLKG